MTQVIKYPLATEKSIRLMEARNTLIFIVDKKSKKEEIKKSIESAYNVKVTKVNTYYRIYADNISVLFIVLSFKCPFFGLHSLY